MTERRRPQRWTMPSTTTLDDEDLNVDDAVRNIIRKTDEETANHHGPFARLYRGETTFDFVGRQRTWFTISTLIIVAGIISIILRGGLNLGIEFKGGTEWTVKAPGVTQTQATNAMQAAGLTAPDGPAPGPGHATSNSTCRPTSTSSRPTPRRRKRTGSKWPRQADRHHAGKRREQPHQVGPTWGSPDHQQGHQR